MRYLFFYLFTSFSILYGQEYFQKDGVEGYILKADIFNDNNYLNPNVEDVECFETMLKEKISGYYSEFYRQYYSKKVNDNIYLIITLVDKKRVKNKEWLKDELYIVIDGCESVRYITYDIKRQEIIRNENGGGCGS